MKCDFCPCDEKVNDNGRFKACHQCRSVSKKCKKNTGTYYNVKSCHYDHGDTIRPRTEGDKDGRAVVFDLHNVADAFTIPEFVNLVSPLIDQYEWVGILSFVGSTTQTRKDADGYIKLLMARCPKLKGYLCFRRNETAFPGTKGGFITCLNAAEVHFFDDGEDHIVSAEAAGVTATLISRDERTARQQISDGVSKLSKE
jgi:hypothetical protein